MHCDGSDHRTIDARSGSPWLHVPDWTIVHPKAIDKIMEEIEVGEGLDVSLKFLCYLTKSF
jgi:hypothetical protein